MGNEFAIIKERVPILDYVTKETRANIKAVGEGMSRANPCPFCGHNDCFTIYGHNQTFNCFSCWEAGDVIHLEKHLRQMGSNFEAAKSLKTRYAITGIELPFPQKTSRADQRKKQLRKEVAVFFHGQLVQNEKALHYQTHDRGHSREVLEQYQVGLAAGDLIRHVTQLGYSMEELEDIGLVRENKNSYRTYIPPGFYVYPQRSGDDVLFFTIKDPDGKKKFQVRKKHADPGWLCMNQDALKKEEVIICEGENDLLSIRDKANQTNVIAIIGNFNTTKILEHLKNHSAGKTVFLVFDRDEAGEKYKKKYAAAIAQGGGRAYIIEIPDPHQDIDELLRGDSNPRATFDRLKANAIELPPLEQQSETPLLESFTSFKVLGEFADERIALWSKANQKIYKVSIRDLNLDKLDQIGGEEVVASVSRQPKDGKITFRALKRVIIVAASNNQLGNPEYVGQGIHQVGNGKLLIVSGAEVWIWDDGKGNRYESPMV